MAMPKGEAGTAKAVVRHNVEVKWESMPNHSSGALSKMLVRPETAGSKMLDFRISCFQPNATAKMHSHKRQEQIYYVLEGEGMMELDGVPTVVRPRDTIFLPPGAEHDMNNTGTSDLVFLVITTPPTDE